MKDLVERIFPIRVVIDPERERLRLINQQRHGEDPFSYKRSERACYQDEPPPTTELKLQGFGVLLGLRLIGPGQYQAVFVTDNSFKVLGIDHQDILAQDSFCDLIAPTDRTEFQGRLDSLLGPESGHETNPVTFQCSILSSVNRSALFWCTSHRSKNSADVVVCEFESDSDCAKQNQPAPRKPSRIFSYEPSADEWAKSTTRTSKPVFPWYGSIDGASPVHSTDLINAISGIQSQLTSATSIESLYGVIVGTISELAEFDRVMLYRFDECRCGAVVAEYLCPEASEDLFFGLHFPSSDLPLWIRELYKEDRVQLLRSRTSSKASIVYRNNDSPETVDLTRSYLRDVGPDRVGIFADLDVSSAMAIALVVDGGLWGMIGLTYAGRLEARMILATGLSQNSPAAFITGSSSTILRLFAAEYGLLVMDDEARAVGKLGSYQEALVLVQYLRARGVRSILASQKITEDFSDLVYAPGFNNIAGLIAIPLSRTGSDFLVFFRKEQLMEIHWAGNTQERFELLGMEIAEPAATFQRWVEHVEHTIEIAGVLSTLYGLVRTPLNQIINYLELSLDSDMEETTRSHIEASLKSSKSLLYVINDLLDLTKVEEFNILMHEEPFSLRDVMHEVVGTFSAEAERKGLAISFSIDSMFLIEQVIGDAQRLRQAVANILSNSLAHSDHGVIDVEIYPVKDKSSTDAQDTLTIAIRDQGEGMTEQQLDTLFIQLENLLDEDEEEDDDGETNRAHAPAASIGLGLAVVARYVRNSNGQMKIETMLGRGTRVSLLLPLRTTTGTQPHPLPTPPSDLNTQESHATTTLSDTLESSHSQSLDMGHTPPTSLSPIASPFPAITAGGITRDADCFPFPPAEHVALRVLVAEDNPLNARVVKMQLTKLGHEVTAVGDGQACLDKFKSDTAYFDLILMDFQMPIVDGPTSAKAIRAYERDCSPMLSNLASVHKRIPIFAVSASLVEEKREEYIETGFDGWILKPVRFKRLDTMMSGIWNEDVRKQCHYSPGKWESGGWLT
ncbi:hypothetical protein FKW77_005303 [Venturia effusa]|uniref:Histidine kinase n=1 Tax=Venturia effusa TaxID=50376 RepID=A0A517L3A2_9PEZI|nr:hypothetical protein FKW77_005303 [Venturia effusa]